LQVARETLLAYPRERDANNRPFHFALGAGYAARLYPQAPEAARWRAYAEAVWDDFYTYGDFYEPGYIAHNFSQVIELGELLGKEEEIRGQKMRAMYDRLRDHISPSGQAVEPGDGGYGEDYVEGLTRAARVTRDGTYLWAAERAFLASPVSKNTPGVIADLPPERRQELLRRQFGTLYDAGIKPELPLTRSAVQQLYPLTHRVPDRVILSPGREPGKPYAGMYINDTAETLHHAHEDNRGEIYHYEADGVLLLKRISWQKWAGQTNTFVVGDPTIEFPFNYSGGMKSGHWYRADANIRPLRLVQEDDRWKRAIQDPLDEPYDLELFDQKNSAGGFSWENPRGFSGEFDRIKLREVTLSLHNFPRSTGGAYGATSSPDDAFPSALFWYRDYRDIAPADGSVGVLLRGLRLTGPAGTHELDALAALPSGTRAFLYPAGGKGKAGERLELAGEELGRLIKPAIDPESQRQCLRVTVPPGRLDLRFTIPEMQVDLTKEYPRLGFDYRYESNVSEYLRTPIAVFVNGLRLRSIYVDQQQGGQLVSAQADTRDGDSAGDVRYDGVYTSDSAWRRRAILTREGYLVVLDEFTAGPSAGGMVAGPVWQLPNVSERGLNWFSAMIPNTDTSLLVYLDPRRGREFSSQFQPKLWAKKEYAVYAKGTLDAGRTERFVSVLIPFNTGKSSAANIAGKSNYHGALIGKKELDSGITTSVSDAGETTAIIRSPDAPPVRVRLSDSSWSVERSTGR
jgi:hypothetical protein